MSGNGEGKEGLARKMTKKLYKDITHEALSQRFYFTVSAFIVV